MISYLLVQTRDGQIRFETWYQQFSQQERQKIKTELHMRILKRSDKFANCLEYMGNKIIYKRFAGLFFMICIDYQDNELQYLEFLQLFVEILNTYFGNVSELNFVYQSQEIYVILNELIIGGYICETSKDIIMKNVGQLKRLE